MRWLRLVSLLLLSLSLIAPLTAQFIVNSNRVSLSFNTSFSSSWPYTETDSTRTTPFTNSLLGTQMSLIGQWYYLSRANRDQSIDEGRNILGAVLSNILGAWDYSLETEHSLLINFGKDADVSPTLNQSVQPLSYYGRISLALSLHKFIRLQLNPLGIGLMAVSLENSNLTYIYIAPLQLIRIDLPIRRYFLRVEYEGSLLAFAYNFEHRLSSDLKQSNALIGNFRIGFFAPSFYSTSTVNRPYIGGYLGMQLQRLFGSDSSVSGLDWSQGSVISRLQIGFTSWLAAPQSGGGNNE